VYFSVAWDEDILEALQSGEITDQHFVTVRVNPDRVKHSHDLKSSIAASRVAGSLFAQRLVTKQFLSGTWRSEEIASAVERLLSPHTKAWEVLDFHSATRRWNIRNTKEKAAIRNNLPPPPKVCTNYEEALTQLQVKLKAFGDEAVTRTTSNAEGEPIVAWGLGKAFPLFADNAGLFINSDATHHILEKKGRCLTLMGQQDGVNINLTHAMLPRERKIDFIKGYTLMKDMVKEEAGVDIAPIVVITDYSHAEIAAIEEVFHPKMILLCQWHVGQAWLRNLSTGPLKPVKSKLWQAMRAETEAECDQLVEEAMEMARSAGKPKKAEYIKSTYAHNTAMWADWNRKSMILQQRKTNAALESMHNIIKRKMGRKAAPAEILSKLLSSLLFCLCRLSSIRPFQYNLAFRFPPSSYGRFVSLFL